MRCFRPMLFPSRLSWVLLGGLIGMGCGTQGYQPYYETQSDPEFDRLSIDFEAGNIGGQEIVILGSNFGDEPSDVVVLLDNHNAEVLSVSDGEIVIRTPRGPITGGAVDLLIATESGYTLAEEAYTYQIGDFSGGGTYEDETAYITVTNLFNSCYGGLGFPGCETISFVGQSGIDGSAEFFTFGYPRVHTPNQGWLSGTDVSENQWVVRPPDPPFPSGIDDLRRHVGEVKLRNPAYAGEQFCVDFTQPFETGPHDCSGADVVFYDRGVLEFCEGEDPETGPDYTYRADWPVNHNFFAPASGDPTEPVEIVVDAADAGMDERLLRLPGAMVPVAEAGFSNPDDWFLNGAFAQCYDADGDGNTLLDEDGVTFSWDPIPDSANLGGDGVISVNSYVHASFTYVTFGWYGLELNGLRASAVFPDDANIDADTGRSTFTIPNSILYQIPTPNAEWTSYNDLTGVGTLGTYESDASYLFFEIYRVTDYKILTDDGPVVFSYMTGDMSIADWSNPTARDGGCENCLDDDGDGWTDEVDPDCNPNVGGSGDQEDNATFGDFTCNDGLDNDANGFTDIDDDFCEVGWDGETNCGDGEDNDGDGWVDALDAECVGNPSGQELGEDPVVQCSDGLDNDGDGWFDAEDPGCTDGLGDDEGGYLGTQCNDGIDNDGHGDIDSEDPYCADAGGGADTEEPVWISQCTDGIDNDNDGFLDGLDPGCEVSPYSRENGTLSGIAPQCYDGLDNDGDGVADADDPSCWIPDPAGPPSDDYVPDGFVNDEGLNPASTGCNDGIDNDGDGWPDGLDPDCQPYAGVPDEVGLGTTECNDGIDNDGDGDIDSADSSYCTDGEDTWEGP